MIRWLIVKKQQQDILYNISDYVSFTHIPVCHKVWNTELNGHLEQPLDR